jgi:hypothetical protein
MNWEAPLFDLRTEAEMRLHSDRVARELAMKKRREEGGEEQTVADATVATEEERGA